ncbi:putative toxin-antitoxin system toxin component, PIN family [bacterium]|nr:putative toxin-antitoxin system toxin component, PIN family [bacterium]
MKVFLDTNVLVSAFATRGLCADVLRTVLAEHELVTGTCVLDELERVLESRFGIPKKTVVSIILFLRRFHIEPTPEHLPDISIRDPDDLKALASACAAKADVLVSGDQDILSLTEYCTIVITDPRGFWNMLKESADPDHS